MTPIAAIQLLLAYLLGSIPSAYLAGKWAKGLDIRQHGSGNMGATNVFRVLGPLPGVLVLLADIAKGVLAVLLLPRLAPVSGAWWPCLFGLAAVLGHSYTLFLGFKGGKGVATSLGVFLGLAPLATLAALLVFGGVFWATRMVSAGSLAAAALLPSAVVGFKEWSPEGAAAPAGLLARPILCLALVLSLLVWLRHLPNIRRILAGTENRFGSKSKSSAKGA